MEITPTSPMYDCMFGSPVFGKPIAQDFREEKPGLHMLYTKTAVDHIGRIMDALDSFSSCANLNMTEPTLALQLALMRLICWNTAYEDAWEIYLTTIKNDTERYHAWIEIEFTFRKERGLPINLNPHTSHWLKIMGRDEEDEVEA